MPIRRWKVLRDSLASTLDTPEAVVAGFFVVSGCFFLLLPLDIRHRALLFSSFLTLSVTRRLQRTAPLCEQSQMLKERNPRRKILVQQWRSIRPEKGG